MVVALTLNDMLPKTTVKQVLEWLDDFEKTNPENWIVSGGTFEEDAYLLFKKILAWDKRQRK
jgi:hypothetical protein